MAFEVKVPAVGESVQEGEVSKWHKSDGDYVALDDVLVEIETDKATVDIVAEASGAIAIKVAEGETVRVGDILAVIDTSVQASSSSDSTGPNGEIKRADTSAPLLPKSSSPIGIMSPAAQRVVTENKIDTTKISGSGKGGRITKQDALESIGSKTPDLVKAAPQIKEQTLESSHFAAGGARSTRVEKMSRLRRTIARRLVEAQHEAAMLTTFNEVDMSEVMSLRKKYKDSFKDKYGVNLGFMSFFVKAAVEALQAFPRINASLNGEEILYHDYCDIGIAVSTDRGLIVPVVRDCEQMSFDQIESRILEYALKGRDGKIGPDELAGGTFTITNGGVFGSLMSTPILTPPQSAILGMHKIQERAMVLGGQVVPRPMMYLAMTYDHRIVDGKEAVGFLVRIKDCLEDPARLLLGV